MPRPEQKRPEGRSLLAEEMERRSLTQQALADLLGMHQSTISRLLAGDARSPLPEHAFAFYEHLGIPIESWYWRRKKSKKTSARGRKRGKGKHKAQPATVEAA